MIYVLIEPPCAGKCAFSSPLEDDRGQKANTSWGELPYVRVLRLVVKVHFILFAVKSIMS